jgi:D-beta-D-heptose 7-phosphate kinase/D-beta-D-heptose 1-phosphate adenosyltransferase
MSLHLPDFATSRILVIGDVMLDRYWYGDTGRISPEAPVPVVHVQRREERAGGAGNVAMNIAALGGRVQLLGLVGEDEAGATLGRLVAGAGCDATLVPSDAHPTITKLRVISRHQQLIRLDFEEHASAVEPLDLQDAFEAALADADCVVLSDYGKGTLSDPAALIARARQRAKTVIVDPKRKDFLAYRGATLVTPNMSEFQAVVGHCGGDDELVTRGHQLMADTDIQGLLITRSEHGMTLLLPGQPALNLPARAREVFDVTGAGDTVVAVLAAAVAAGLPVMQAAVLSNLAAGIVVGRLGTATVVREDLEEALTPEQLHQRGIVDEATLVRQIAEARKRGERIVMTNGCFDLLHPGHVGYLEQAAALGDRLVIAVNDDDSVRRLKGAARPVNPLTGRMAVLAGLRSVDWVVAFSEDTPERLICRIRPDVLVKGGDYLPDQIAGGDCVSRSGGKVVVLDYVDGCSTSSLIESIRGNT